MSHLDEGTLHSLLDGELRASEVAAINAHLAGCSACSLRLRDAKDFRAEADRLIESVDLAETPVARSPLLGAEAAAAPPIIEPAVPERPEPMRAEPVRAEPVRPEPVRAEPVRPEPVRAEPVRAEPARSGPVRPEPLHHEVPKVEAPRPPRERRPERAAQPPAPDGLDPWNSAPPPLLIPDNEGRADRQHRLLRRLSIAATIAVVVGTGALAYKLRPGAAAFQPPQDSLADAPPQVVSSLERSGADTVPLTAAPSLPRDRGPAASAEAKSAPSTLPPAARALVAAKAARPAPTRPAAGAPAPQAQSPARTDALTLDTTAANVPETTAAEDAATDSATDANLVDVRRRAAEALAQLDRDRRRNQAAAATAALDQSRKRGAAGAAAPAVAPAAAPAPPPLTIEQRAGVYLRIGLDEASRQLGGPAHVIEGMGALFTGLAQGHGLQGADSTRPVVRVVYQDTQGRLVFLDQQRLRSGQSVPESPLAWQMGETGLWLRGEPPGEYLRTLRPRVR
jgi:putative zinc finger protein